MKKKIFVIATVFILLATLPVMADNTDNHPPAKPTITGPSSGKAGETYTYTATTIDPDGDKIFYCFDWGDGNEFCSNYVNSGESIDAQHSWSSKGTYTVKVIATDEHGAKSEPATLTVSMPLVKSSNLVYEGLLKIYVVEPVSRWDDHDGKPYKFGFLDFAYDDSVELPYMEKKNISVIWDASKAGYGDVSPGNLMAIAVLLNPVPHDGFANPPFGNKFEAHYVDACAAAVPGGEGKNVRANATHTVFAEMGTATWCPYCPAMLEGLYGVYSSGKYPFYFVSMVADKNDKAMERLEEYNIYGYPTAFFDGGRKVLVGGISQLSVYERAVEYMLNKDVHEFNMSISCSWEDGKLRIDVELENVEDVDDTPPQITVEKPLENYLYIFDRQIMPLPFGKTVIIGKITMLVDAEDDSGISKVVFKILHETEYEDTDAPYEFEYKGKFGSHDVEVMAYDIYGNENRVDFTIFVI